MNHQDIRSILLEIIAEKDKSSPDGLHDDIFLNEFRKRFDHQLSHENEEAILTCWYDLFRNGILAWGYNFSNPKPPWCHVTSHGRKILENLSRDPGNPKGYLAYLHQKTAMNPIAQSYIEEALNTYNTDCFKASAVMVGAASESLVLTVRDSLVKKMDLLKINKSQDLVGWKVKKILAAIENVITQRKKLIPALLFESFEAHWPAFTYYIRTVRNDSGHPSSVESVTLDSVHASLLIFPELAILVDKLLKWIEGSMTE